MPILDRPRDSRFPSFEAPLDPDNLTVCRAGAPETATKRILIVRTIANGDILMSTPLIASLRAALPSAHLTYLVERRERESVDANPHIDRLLLWDTAFWKGMSRRGNYLAWYRNVRALRDMLHEEKFDILISLMPEDWGWLVGAAGATHNIGLFDTFREYHRQRRTSRRARLYQTAYTFSDLPIHRTDQYLLPLQSLGLPALADRRMHLGFTHNDSEEAAVFQSNNNLGDRFVIVAPRAGWPSRCWPTERWAEFCDALCRTVDCRILLVGGAGDRSALEEIGARIKSTVPVIAAGAFGFRQLAALTQRAMLTVSGDTGPMHVSAAVGTPYLALFGPTPAERFAPLAARGLPLYHPVPCGPCHQRNCVRSGDENLLCLKLTSVKEAIESATALVNNESGRKTLSGISK